MGAGQNLQYTSSNPESNINVRDENLPVWNTSNKTDINAIYLDKPTHLIQNINKDLNEEGFIRYLFQLEFLLQSGKVSIQQLNQQVSISFKHLLASLNTTKELESPNNGFLYKDENIKQHFAKYIIQAIGRICRTNLKSTDIYVFADIDLDKLNRITQESNESLGNVQNYLNPLLGIGAYLKTNTYFFGLSVPNFLNTKRFKEVNGIQATATDKPHLYASGGFSWKVNNTISIVPSFLYRIVSDAPNQITAIGKINFKDQLQLGMGMSNNDYISAMLVFSGMQKLDFGYGYEMGQRTSSTALRANTHELFLRFKFGNQTKQVITKID